MMRKYKLYIVAIVLILFQLNATAQELDSKTRRTINNEIYNLLDDYERYGRLTDNLSYIVPEFKEKYNNIFSKNARVFCDIVLANNLDSSVSVDKYIELTELFYPQGIGISVLIDKISMPKHLEGNSYLSSVQANKIIYGNSKFNLVYEDTFQLDISINYEIVNLQIENIRISNIGGPLSGKYINLIFTSKKGKDPLKQLTVDYKIDKKQNEITTNDEGKATINNLSLGDIVEFSIESKQFYHHKAILSVKEFIAKRNYNSKIDPNLFHIDLKRKIWNAGINVQLLNANLSLGNNFYIDPTVQSIDNSVNAGIGLSGYINYIAGFKNKTDWGLGVGLLFNSFSINSNLNSWEETYSDIDPSGLEYDRTVLLSNIEESSNLTFFEIPISAFLRQGITNKLYLTANIGINASFAIKTVSSSTAQGEYIGQYGTEMFNIEISDNRIYDFGNYDVENSEDNQLEFDTGLSPFIDIGIEYVLTNDLNIKVGGQLVQNWIELVPNESYNRLSSGHSDLNSTLSGYDALSFSKFNIYIGISKDF